MSQRKFMICGLAVLVAVNSTGAAAQTAAEESPTPEFQVSANAALMSDYRVRGISQTSRKPAFQGGFDVAHSSGLYVGNYNSNVSYFSDAGLGSSSIEIDVYGGYRAQVAKDLSLDVGVFHYHYPGDYDPGITKPHTTEVYAGVAYGPIAAKYWHSVSNYFGIPGSDDTGYGEINLTHAFGESGVTAIAHVGRTSVAGRGNSAFDYEDWSLTISKDLGAGFSLGATYIDTNARRLFYTDSRGRYLGKSGGIFYLKRFF